MQRAVALLPQEVQRQARLVTGAQIVQNRRPLLIEEGAHLRGLSVAGVERQLRLQLIVDISGEEK